MTAENIPMFSHLPIYQEDLDKAKRKKIRINCLQEMLLELMEKRNVSLSEIHKRTEIPWGTLMDWHNGNVHSQKADKNLLRLARYFNVTLEYLCFGIGDDSKAFENFQQGEN